MPPTWSIGADCDFDSDYGNDYDIDYDCDYDYDYGDDDITRSVAPNPHHFNPKMESYGSMDRTAKPIVIHI